MKIRKNGKVVRLTESDLQRIVKRTLNESSYSEMNDGDVKLPNECKEDHLKKVMRFMSEKNDVKIKIQTGNDYGIGGKFGGEILVITDPNGRVCGCKKEDFFAGGI